MRRWSGTHRALAAVLLSSVAATLACSGLSGPAGGPNAALTQAAGTAAAVSTSSLAALTALAPTAEALATQVAGTVAPTVESNPTAAATPVGAATTVSAATASAGGPTQPPAASGSAINPCSLITSADATPLVGGAAIGAAQYQNDSCLFTNDSNTAQVALFVLPPDQAQAFLAIYMPVLLSNNAVTVEPDLSSKVAQDAAAGDMPAAVNDLLAMTSGLPGYHVEKLDGIGNAALWLWHPEDQDQVGALIAGQPGALVALVVTGSPTTQETDDQPMMETIVRRVLSQLPASFTLATP